MSRTYKDSKKGTRRGRPHNISVRAIRKSPPDLRKLSRAVIAFALAEAEAEVAAQREHEHEVDTSLDTPEVPDD